MTNHVVLEGIRILDFTWVLAGPYATRLLADFGAEIIKVHPPMPEAQNRFARGYHNAWNRNKLGITLNLNLPEGIALVERLIKVSDAVMENFAPRVMANWGLDYEHVKKIKPDIIMLSMSTMGQTGHSRDYTGFGPTIHAFSGITHLASYPGKPPSGLGFSYADHVSGLVAVLALLGALEHLRRTGEGQYIDLSQMEAMTGLIGDSILEYGVTGTPPEPMANRSADAAPHGVYRCLGDERWCAISVSGRQWRGFKRALDNPQWAGVKKFGTIASRLKNADELDRMVEAWTLQHTAEEVMTLLQGEGIAAGVVQNAEGLASDPHLKARSFFVGLQHPELGKTVSDANPIRMSASPARYRRAAPLPGQDNDYVFRRLLGLSEEEVTGLRRRGVIRG
ncbi:MAG: CoA transferase [Chloroflexi bacterium]|nr:CoA transferase [Chloroflexota bacterium]